MGGPAAAGAKLGRYQVVKHLASGGMAEVLLARATGIEGFTRHVVIKRIRPSHAEDAAFVTMFLNEARLAAQLHHHNIVQVHDIGQEGNEYFFAMEYVHGEDLRRLLTHLARHKQKLPLEHVVTIISAAAVALHHAHEQVGTDRKPLNIVHRDVTPANILVGYDGHVKVVDFGIAKAAVKTTEVTQAGALKGKASYMSPEQCTGNSPVDRRSDVFALGIVAYELATTRRLFKGENDFLTMSSIVGGKIPPPTTHRPDMPAQLEAIILKALAPKPEDRYQTADAMREALDQFASDARLRTTTTSLAAYMKMQFGEKPEPWLSAADAKEDMVISIDFDGSATGMAMAPQQSVESMDLPAAVNVAAEAPIVRARSKAISQAPPLKKLPAVVAAKPARPATQQIPIVQAVKGEADKSRPVRLAAPPASPSPLRKKTITVQIPAQNQAAGVGAQPRTITMDASSGVPLPGMAPMSDSSATAVSGIPKDVDSSWDPSRPVQMPKDTSAAVVQPAAAQPAAAAKPVASATTASASQASVAATTSAPSPGPTSPSAIAAKSGVVAAPYPIAPSAAVAAPAANSAPTSAAKPTVAASSTPKADPTPVSGSKSDAKPASASASGGWSPTKLTSRSTGEKAALPSPKTMANGSSSRIPGVADKPVDKPGDKVDPLSKLDAEVDGAQTKDAAKKSNGAAALFSTNVAPNAAVEKLADASDSSATQVSAAPYQEPSEESNGARAAAALAATASSDASNAAPSATNDVLAALAKADANAQAAAPSTGKPVRDSAPALPPPPAVQVIPLSALAEAAGEKIEPIAASSPIRDFATPIPSGDPTPLPGVSYPSAQGLLDRNDPSAARIAAAAPTTYPTASAKDWSGTASEGKPAVVAKLLASKRNLAIAGGAVVLLIIVLVFALSGGKKTSSSAKTEPPKPATSPASMDTKSDDTKSDDTKSDDTKADDTKADDTTTDDTTSDDTSADDSADSTASKPTATTRPKTAPKTPVKSVATKTATPKATTKTTAKTTTKTTAAKTATAKTTTTKTPAKTTTAKTTKAPTTAKTTATKTTTTAKTSTTTKAPKTTTKTPAKTTTKTPPKPTTKTPAKTTTTKTPAKSTTDKKWDPNSLFPSK